jgi:hypothetical protein
MMERLKKHQFHNEMKRYIRSQMNVLMDQYEWHDRLRLQQVNPDDIDSDPIILDKLQIINEQFYTDREQLVRWFEELELAYTVTTEGEQEDDEEGPPYSRLELHPARLCVNWKATRCDFISKKIVRAMLEAAKLKAHGQPRTVPSEGYSTGYVLCAYFEQVLDEDYLFMRKWFAAKMREKHAAIVSLRRNFFAVQHPATSTMLPLTPSPVFLASLLENSPLTFAQFLPPPPLPQPPVTPVAKGKPSQSQLAKRLLWYECESKNLRCAICLESESLLPGSCVMFMCSHYVCELCYPSVEGKRCPLCRKEIKVSVDEGC